MDIVLKTAKLLTVLLITFTGVFSADIGVDFKLGAGLDVSNRYNGLDVTVALPINFSEKLAFQPELHFYSRGKTNKYKKPFTMAVWMPETGTIDSITSITRSRFTRYYLELPLLFKVKIPKEKISPYFALGHSFGIGLGTREKHKGTSERYKVNNGVIDIELLPKNDKVITSFTVGLIVQQFGIEISLGKGHLILEQRYQLGLIDRTRDKSYLVFYFDGSDEYKEFLHQFSFQIGYGF